MTHWWLLAAALVCTVPGSWSVYQLLTELRVNFPAEWDHLGRLTIFTPMSVRQERRWAAFFLTRRYAKLGSRRLTWLGTVILLWAIANTVFIIIAALTPN